jgi:hypothetical protein
MAQLFLFTAIAEAGQSAKFAEACSSRFSIIHFKHPETGDPRRRPGGQLRATTNSTGIGICLVKIAWHDPEIVRVSYSNDMDHLLALRDKVSHLREEIADIQQLNEQFRRNGLNGPEAQAAHGQRNERLQAIQQELVRLAQLSRKVISAEEMREKHRTRLHLVRQKRAS